MLDAQGWNGWKGWTGWKFISFSGKIIMWLEFDSLFCPLSVFWFVAFSLFLSVMVVVYFTVYLMKYYGKGRVN